MGNVTRARRWVLTFGAELSCGALLLVMSGQMLVTISRKSITDDEIVTIPAAYYHVVDSKFQYVHEHPPLSKILAALPLLLIQPDEPTEVRSRPALSIEDKWEDQMRFWEQNDSRFATISFWTRVPMIALSIVLGVMIFAFARKVFGKWAAVLAVALFSLEPTVLAHGRVVQTDMVAAFGYLLTFTALYGYIERSTYRRAIWLGAATGVALLTKYSMLIVGPVLIIFLIALLARTRERQKRASLIAQAVLVTTTAVIIINATYYFQHRPLAEADAQWIQGKFPSLSGSLTQLTSALSYLLPTDFVLGILEQIVHSREGHPASLLGMYSRFGWWYYIPVAFALKTTLPFLLLSLASLGWAGREWIRKREAHFLWLLGAFGLYTIFMLFNRIDIGVRYYLPAYPFLFILGGALLASLLKSRRVARLGMFAAIILIAWIGVEAVRAFPNHISYMNQLASREPHWWYLSDSNVEWGDDIAELAAYLRAHNETQVRSAFLGDFLVLHHYGVEPAKMANPIEAPAKTRYAAIGASFLNGSSVPEIIQGHLLSESERVNYFDKYRHKMPEAIFGGSIYLYREDLDENQ